MYYYAFTLRNLSHPKPEDYPPAISAFKQKYTDVDVRYHYEVKFKKNGHHNVHIHGVMKSLKKLSYRMLKACCPFPNVHAYLDLMKHQGWISYITKQSLNTIQDVNLLLDGYHSVGVTASNSEASLDYDPPDPLEKEITCNLFLKRTKSSVNI